MSNRYWVAPPSRSQHREFRWPRRARGPPLFRPHSLQYFHTCCVRTLELPGTGPSPTDRGSGLCLYGLEKREALRGLQKRECKVEQREAAAGRRASLAPLLAGLRKSESGFGHQQPRFSTLQRQRGGIFWHPTRPDPPACSVPHPSLSPFDLRAALASEDSRALESSCGSLGKSCSHRGINSLDNRTALGEGCIQHGRRGLQLLWSAHYD